ncbi:MAG: hypothetical protein J7639_13050 [Paenibacillaceae bacterium]|nr:hypothetical protein [Paenibacillaceae bacterium]
MRKYDTCRKPKRKPDRRPSRKRRLPSRCHRARPHRILQVQGSRFLEGRRLNETTTDEWTPVLLVNSAVLQTYSFVGINKDRHPALIRIEISPNAADFTTDAKATVSPGDMQVLTPMRYLKYARISIKSAHPGQPAKLDLYFQAQTAG